MSGLSDKFDCISNSQQASGPLGEMSRLIGCSLHIQQPAAAKLYSKSYASVLVAAALWLQPLVRNCDVSPYRVYTIIRNTERVSQGMCTHRGCEFIIEHKG